jgi:hypothetical protein
VEVAVQQQMYYETEPRLTYDAVPPLTPVAPKRQQDKLKIALGIVASVVTVALVIVAIWAAKANSYGDHQAQLLASTRKDLARTSEDLAQTSKDLAAETRKVTDLERDLQNLRTELNEARTNADVAGDERDLVIQAIDGLNDCINAWSGFANGYDNRSIYEDGIIIDRAVAVCNPAIDRSNAISDRLQQESV